MNRVRMTVVYEFDYQGEVTDEVVDRLSHNFIADPTGFYGIGEMAWDEKLVVEFEDITEENNGD